MGYVFIKGIYIEYMLQFSRMVSDDLISMLIMMVICQILLSSSIKPTRGGCTWFVALVGCF